MKTLSIIVIFALICPFVWGQMQIPLSNVGSAGNNDGQININGNASSVEWTIGELFIGNGSFNNQSVTIGEQQGIPNLLTGIDRNIDKDVSVYPNPASSFLMLNNLPQGNNKIKISDLNGRKIFEISTVNNSETFYIENLPTGIYLLSICNESNKQTIYKILIINN